MPEDIADAHSGTFGGLPRKPALTLLIFLGLCALHLCFTPGVGPYGVDGSFYFQVARHIAEGDGIVTSVSLYHQGLNPLPQQSNIYPLWPLVLGGAGRIMGMVRAANILPQIFFAFDLLLLSFLVRRLSNDFEPSVADISAILAVVLFGTNPIFFSSTAMPYTEGLGFALCIGALLALSIHAHPALSGLLAGVLAGAAFLTRSQLIGVLPAIFLALLLEAVRSRSPLRPLTFVSGAAATVIPWLVFLHTFVKPFTLASVISMYNQTPALGYYQLGFPTSSLSEYLLDRLKGVLVAFNIFSPLSFAGSFGVAALLPPIAGVSAIWFWRRHSLPPDARKRSSLLLNATVLTGLALSGMLFLIHNAFFLPWLFGYRHGLVYVLLIAAALPFLLSRASRAIRTLTWILVAVSIITGTSQIIWNLAHPRREGPSAAERQLSVWLDRQHPLPTVVTTNAQIMAVYSRANFHWTTCTESSAKTRRMLELLPIEYVMVYSFERDCSFVRDLGEVLTPRYQFGRGPESIYVFQSNLRRTAVPVRAPVAPQRSVDGAYNQ